MKELRGGHLPVGRARSLHVHLDLVGGIAGDMFAAAMVDALPSLREPVLAELAAFRPAAGGEPRFVEAGSAGLRAQRFGLQRNAAFAATGASAGRSAESPRAGHEHAAAADPASVCAHHGTAYPALRRLLLEGPLAPATRTHALALLALLGEAEAQVHGIALEAVHFHELADWDSLMDLVAAGCIIGALDGAGWSASTPPLGGGTVRTAHGVLPVPTPATSLLLTGYPWAGDGIAGERVTPTGAAILRHLVPAHECGRCAPGGRLLGSGYGAGSRELPGLPNVLRAVVLETSVANDGDSSVAVGGDTSVAVGGDTSVVLGDDRVAVIEFDIDDMTGEEIAVAADRLRQHPAVVDVSIGARWGKKGRAMHDFRILARPTAVDALAALCFSETSTLGLRVREEARRVLPREEVIASAGESSLAVKRTRRPDGSRTAKAAHDGLAPVTGLARRRRLAAERERTALDSVERTLLDNGDPTPVADRSGDNEP